MTAAHVRAGRQGDIHVSLRDVRRTREEIRWLTSVGGYRRVTAALPPARAPTSFTR